MTTALAPTRIQEIPLADLLPLTWPTDPQVVQSFQSSIQNMVALPPIQVNALRDGDRIKHEIIDGFHRVAAALAERQPTITAQIVEYDERTAMYARIQASIGKPSEVLIARAIRALRACFISDILAELQVMKPFCYRVLNDDGSFDVKTTNHLPSEPEAALEVIYEHSRASTFYKAQRQPRYAQVADIDQVIDRWLEDIARRFGKTKRWMTNSVFTGRLFVNDADSSQISTRFSDYSYLWDIPDVQIRTILRKRLEDEVGHSGAWSKSDAYFCVAYLRRLQLGKRAMLNWIKRYPTFNQLNKALSQQIEKQEEQELHTPRTVPVDVAAAVDAAYQAVTERDHSEYVKTHLVAQALGTPQDQLNDVVFTAVSPKFIPAQQRTAVKARQNAIHDDYRPLHEAIQHLIITLRAYDETHINWQMKEAQADLQALRVALYTVCRWQIEGPGLPRRVCDPKEVA